MGEPQVLGHGARSGPLSQHRTRVASVRAGTDISALADELVVILRERPRFGRVVNALEHMWGHAADAATAEERRDAQRDARRLMLTTRAIALRAGEPYRTMSTALTF